MNVLTPLRRSKQLQPLSREHHEGLLFVWKIREGLKNNTSIDKLRDYTAWYWRHHIKPHFFQEEKVLLKFISATHPLTVRMKEDHEDIRELILSIDKDAERQELLQLVNLIETHIRFEERQLFQYLEEQLSKGMLTDILTELEKHPLNQGEKWEDEFWLCKSN